MIFADVKDTAPPFETLNDGDSKESRGFCLLRVFSKVVNQSMERGPYQLPRKITKYSLPS
jgi:hypothetical protein